MKPLLLLLLSFCISSIGAQSMIEETIFKAKDEFEAGRLEQVIELLKPYTFSYNQNKIHRKTVLRILTESYLFLDESDQAQTTYLELLRLDPFYKINTTVPELKYLSQRIETYPVSTYRFYGGVHLFSQPILKKQYSPAGVTVDDYNYNLDSIAAPIGSFVAVSGSYKIFNSNWDISFGYNNWTQYYYYNAMLSNATNLEGNPSKANLHFFEKQRWSKISIGLAHQFIKRDKVIRRSIFPFIAGNISYDILHKGPNFLNDLSIEFEDGTSISKPPFRISDLRNKTNISIQLELGVRVHSNRYFVEFGIQYNQYLQLIANPAHRNNNTALVNTFNYLDDDFTFHNFSLFVGTGMYFFKSKTKAYIPL